MLQVFERLAKRRTEKKREALNPFWDLVTRLADGEEIDADEILLILEQCDKSDADLQQAVDSQQSRPPAQERLRIARESLVQKEVIESQIQKLLEEKQEAIRKFDEKLSPLGEQYRNAELLSLQVPGLTANLQSSCQNPIIRNELADKRDAIAHCLEQIRTAASELTSGKLRLDSVQTRVNALTRENEGLIAYWTNKNANLGGIFLDINSSAAEANQQPIRQQVKDAKKELAAEQKACDQLEANHRKLTLELEQLRKEQAELLEKSIWS